MCEEGNPLARQALQKTRVKSDCECCIHKKGVKRACLGPVYDSSAKEAEYARNCVVDARSVVYLRTRYSPRRSDLQCQSHGNSIILKSMRYDEHPQYRISMG